LADKIRTYEEIKRKKLLRELEEEWV